jgi:hypothetical protein
MRRDHLHIGAGAQNNTENRLPNILFATEIKLALTNTIIHGHPVVGMQATCAS